MLDEEEDRIRVRLREKPGLKSPAEEEEPMEDEEGK